MTKKAGIYARVSTDDQRDNYSIPTQVAACLQHAQSKSYAVVGDRFVDLQSGLDVTADLDRAIRAYVDDYTSRELSRPALDAALVYLETAGFDVLIVHALDRLARDPYIRRTLEMEFEKRGARVEYVLGNYDDTPEGEIRKDIDATFAKWENAKRVERCNRGKKRKAETGLFVAGRAPRRILTNTIYVGYGFYNKHKRNGDRLEKKNQEEWVRFETTPIIEPWLFEQAQLRLEENEKARRRQPARFYLLSGMVFCAACNRPYLTQAALAGRSRRTHDAQSYRH